MNYIWDVLIRAHQLEEPQQNIVFEKSEDIAPYMEINKKFINTIKVKGEIEINPYYRFYSIFKTLFDPNYLKYEEFRNKLFDLIIHFLGEIDKYQGLTKGEYYKNYILEDIEDGIFGEKVKSNFDIFSVREKNIIAENIYKIYNTGKIIFFLKKVIKKIYPNSNFYLNKNMGNEILLYLDYEKNKANEKKLDLIKQMFLPFEFKIDVYWDFHFGVIDVYNTMRIDEISIYEEEQDVEWKITNKEE